MILKIKIPHQMGSASFLQSVQYNNQTGLCQHQAHAIGIVKQEHNKNKNGWVRLPAF
jgi:lipid II:glycine glycyltransferase (peptidoglycan interpeptide bridge formation enzyme)